MTTIPNVMSSQPEIERTEERPQMNTESDREAGLSIALSVLMMVSGILAIILPRASGIAVTASVGWLLLLSGAAHVAYAWQSGGGFWWGIVLGLIQMLAGGYALLYPGAGLASLTLVLAACLVVESILEFILSYLLRLFVVESGWLLLDGIVTLVLSIIMWRTWSGSTLGLIATLVGISMLFSGVTRLMISLAWRSLTKGASG